MRLLDNKDHQESNDSSARVDDELPRVGVMKNGTGNAPNNNENAGKNKSSGFAGGLCNLCCHPVKYQCSLFCIFGFSFHVHDFIMKTEKSGQLIYTLQTAQTQ